MNENPDDPEKTRPQDPDSGPSETADPAASGSASAEGESGPGAEGGADEAALLKDRLLRTMAELENFRRRAAREREDVARFAITRFARDCLGTLDNLRRGLQTVSAGDRQDNPKLEALASGMEMTERDLLSTFERHGITRFEDEGVAFDHERHEAMFEIEDPQKPAGTVATVIEPGYLLNGRLLRPARVGVTRGGPKAGAGGAAETGAGEQTGEESRPEAVQAPIANREVDDDTEPKR